MPSIKGKGRFSRFLLGLALGGLASVGALFGLFEIAELKGLNLLFLLRGEVEPRSPIVIVNIDEDSFDELGHPWPWPRTYHARLIERIAQGKPLAIGFDILFTEPDSIDPTFDYDLALAMKRAERVVLAAFFSEVEDPLYRKEILRLPIPLFRDTASGYGFVNLPLDADGFIRRAILTKEYQDQFYYSFAYELLIKAKGLTPFRSRGSVITNFSGPPGTFRAVPYYQVLNGEIEPSTFNGQIVLVGAFSPSLQDFYSTPFAAKRRMPGVELHANLLETLLQGSEIYRPPRGLQFIFSLFLVLIFCINIALYMPRPMTAFGMVLAFVSIYWSLGIYFFIRHMIWLDIVGPFVSLSITYSGLTLYNEIVITLENARLYEKLKKAFFAFAESLAEAVEKRDPYTGGHIKRVRDYSLMVGKEVGLSSYEMDRLRLAAILHDIGKIGVDDAVLRKSGGLTDEEYKGMKLHTVYGEEILRSIEDYKDIAPSVRGHQERWDGKGYPDCLSGSDIPIYARIIAIADAYDAMTTDRPYRKSPGKEKALEELRRMGGIQFDKTLVEAFIRGIEREARRNPTCPDPN